MKPSTSVRAISAAPAPVRPAVGHRTAPVTSRGAAATRGNGPARVDFGGVGVQWKIDGIEAGGRFAVVHHPLALRALAAPLHFHHREEEFSYVIRGTLGALLGDDVVTAGPGTWVFKTSRAVAHVLERGHAAGHIPRFSIQVIRDFADSSPALRNVTRFSRHKPTHTHTIPMHRLLRSFRPRFRSTNLAASCGDSKRHPRPAARFSHRLLLAILGLTVWLSPWRLAAATVPLFDNVGSYSLEVTTDSAEAQRYFDQGLRFLFGFNHGMAIRSFQEAVARDPECAMAHWGIALACGPHINFPLVPPDKAEMAWKELTLARQHAAQATAFERDLIEALGHRYANPQPEDRAPLDAAYAAAMRQVWAKHPQQPDAGAFFAEALMDLRPWDQWTPEGQPQPGTEEVIAVLDAVLQLDAFHPLANHLYIHAVEASPEPDRAIAAADRLRQLQPGLAHNVHMPSHIDIRVGDWHKAVKANLGAIEADQAYRAKAGPPRDIVVLYAAHNRHMLTFAAMMTGQRELALRHIQEMVDEIPADFVKDWALAAEAFAAMPFEVMVRFGEWDRILAEPDNYPEHMPFTKSLRLAARAIAYAAKGDTTAARAEQAKFLAMAKTVPAGTTLGNNTGAAILAVATPMVEGEILVREGKLDEGFAALREAVKAEDALRYDEPPGWILPVRHALGANLMAHGRHAEAEQVYRADLKRLPHNGWSLFGLADALERLGRTEEAETYRTQFATVWRAADMKIASSCLCQPGV